MEDEVQELVRAAAQGDERALETLLERYLPDVRAFVRLRTGAAIRARESSSDLVQSVCREVLEHKENFRHPNEGAFKRWLFTTALRKILQRQRFYAADKRDVGREVPLAGVGKDSGGDDVALHARYKSFLSPSRGAILREELEQVEAAFDALPDDYREVVTLAHVAGLSRQEIAEQMGKTEGAVRVLLHRALARVAELLEKGSNG